MCVVTAKAGPVEIGYPSDIRYKIGDYQIPAPHDAPKKMQYFTTNIDGMPCPKAGSVINETNYDQLFMQLFEASRAKGLVCCPNNIIPV